MLDINVSERDKALLWLLRPLDETTPVVWRASYRANVLVVYPFLTPSEQSLADDWLDTERGLTKWDIM